MLRSIVPKASPRGDRRHLGPLLFATGLVAATCAPSGDAPVETGATAVSIAAERRATIGCSGCTYSESLAPRDIELRGRELRLLDGFAPFLRIFNLDGGPERELVTEGEGPGEATAPWRVYSLPGETTLVHNSLPPALIPVEMSGGTERARVDLEMRVPENSDLLPSASALWLLTSLPFMPGDAGAPRLGLVDLATGKETPVLSAAELPSMPGDPEAPRGEFTCFPIAATADGNVLVGDAWSYDLLEFSPDGTLLRSFGRRLPRPARPAPSEASLVSLDIADGTEQEIPHFDRRALDRDTVRNEYWVRTWRGRVATETIFDRFSASGDWLGEVIVPLPMERDGDGAFDVENGLLAAVHPTEEGEIVVIWNVVEQ